MSRQRVLQPVVLLVLPDVNAPVADEDEQQEEDHLGRHREIWGDMGIYRQMRMSSRKRIT